MSISANVRLLSSVFGFDVSTIIDEFLDHKFASTIKSNVKDLIKRGVNILQKIVKEKIYVIRVIQNEFDHKHFKQYWNSMLYSTLRKQNHENDQSLIKKSVFDAGVFICKHYKLDVKSSVELLMQLKTWLQLYFYGTAIYF
jgi:hypothetical protein